MIRTLAAAAALAAALGLTGCTVQTTRTVDEAQIEQAVSDRLNDLVGQRPDAVDCPDDLTGVVGTMLRCSLTDGADRYPVDVTVTSVEGDTVNFDFAVADQPLA
ncbi:DUF4333 domain-containing protein [Pseudonocardia sp.]|uniref:DUF4333 domain-containing protein n=1 Tax=Pseudonocardia sp. TaxID=60912 RepID=UPI003D122383